MAKFATPSDDDDIGKPGKPPKRRGFPWRLWMFALLMTAAAGAGGYFAWTYREQVRDIESSGGDCKVKLAESTKAVDDQKREAGNQAKAAADCKTTLASLVW